MAALAAVWLGGCSDDDGGSGAAKSTTTTVRKVDVRATAEASLAVLDKGQAGSPERADELLRACIDLRRAADQAAAPMKADLDAAAQACSTKPAEAAALVRAALSKG